MIITNNWVYVHVPKTAGSSFEQMMGERHGMDTTNDPHSTVRDLPDYNRKHSFIFGLMRDPLIAECSNWRYHQFSWKAEEMTFEKWCEWRFTDKPEEYGFELGLNKTQVEYGYLFAVRPSAGYFCDEEGKCLAHRIYRFEDLGNTMIEISEMIGLDCRLEEDFKQMTYNWSRGKEKYEPHLTDRARELVHNAKAIDFKLHGAEGIIPTDFTCPTFPRYAYTR